MITINTNFGKREIGPGKPVFIIGEMSGNHNMDFSRAKKLIDAAADAGVDAVKLQTYTPETMTINCDKEYFQVNVNQAWAGKTLYDLYQSAYTPWEWQPKLKKYAETKGLILFSTPFDETAVDFLEGMNNQIYKIASFETGDIPLLKRVGKTKKPVIISRGLTSLDELKFAIKTLKENGTPEIAVLHCISSYPAEYDQMNLKTMIDLKEKLNMTFGISDHTLGSLIPLTSVALGASIVEKHFTLKRSDGGPDAAFSLEEDELKDLVIEIRNQEKALGKISYEVGKREKENLVFKRSIFIVENIKKGETFTENNIRIIRPGYGLEPKYYEEILGSRSTRNLNRGEPLKEEHYG
ncbi:MAG: pseudaminic acid synthase [Desulfobacula sp.]|jgi:pseudaminic acid synthase|nr:pseudaminic acid synthase [Desulfobacula sp.]